MNPGDQNGAANGAASNGAGAAANGAASNDAGAASNDAGAAANGAAAAVASYVSGQPLWATRPSERKTKKKEDAEPTVVEMDGVMKVLRILLRLPNDGDVKLSGCMNCVLHDPKSVKNKN